jgi:hypothetical protein
MKKLQIFIFHISSFIFTRIADDAKAPVAQLDRASAFEAEGWGFDSLRAHFFSYELRRKS